MVKYFKFKYSRVFSNEIYNDGLVISKILFICWAVNLFIRSLSPLNRFSFLLDEYIFSRASFHPAKNQFLIKNSLTLYIYMLGFHTNTSLYIYFRCITFGITCIYGWRLIKKIGKQKVPSTSCIMLDKTLNKKREMYSIHFDEDFNSLTNISISTSIYIYIDIICYRQGTNFHSNNKKAVINIIICRG